MAERRAFGIKDDSLRQIPFVWEQLNDDVKTLHLDGPAVDCIPQEELNIGLLKACLIGHRVNVQLFFRWGATIECRDEQGNTPMLISAEKGFTDIVDFLLDNGADVNASNSAGDTPLILSIRSPGSLKTMERILEHALVDIEHANNAGFTALMTAIEEIDLKAIKVLLDANACIDINLGASQEERDLCVTEEANGRDEPMKTVLTARTLVDTFGLGTIMEYLKSKVSPLKTAVLNRDFDSVCLILDSDVSYLNDRGPVIKIVSDFISSEGNSGRGIDDNDIAIVQKLLDSTQHYSFNALRTQIFRYNLSIERAVMFGNYKLIQILCQCCYNRLDMFYNFSCAIISASEKGNSDIVQLLLKYPERYEKNLFESNCREALQRAFVWKNTECEKILLPFLTASKNQLITI